MIRYKEWLMSQDQSFIDELCQGNQIPDTFKDYGYVDITLDGLKALDAKYIINVSERQENKDE